MLKSNTNEMSVQVCNLVPFFLFWNVTGGVLVEENKQCGMARRWSSPLYHSKLTLEMLSCKRTTGQNVQQSRTFTRF